MLDEDEVNTFNEEQIEEFQVAFDLFDRDNDGTINVQQFISIMRTFAQEQYELELEDMFKEADPDNNGTISFTQFMKIMEKNFSEDKTSEGIMNAFRVFDTFQKGVIPAEDLRDYMMTYGDKLTEQESIVFIKMADTRKDGKIVYSEFVSKMASVLEKKPKYKPRFKDEPKKPKSSKKKKK